MSNYYTGTIWRGVDYSPTWPNWSAQPNTQTGDSDFANDAFQAIWSNQYQSAPQGDPSVPIKSSHYRDDLKTIKGIGFNLVRLYDWNMARGTSSSQPKGLDHINFLNYAQTLGLKVVVPVSDYFLGDSQYSWNGQSPDPSYTFKSASSAIQADFTSFIASITDPSTGKIHAAIHSVSVGNEGDIGEGLNGAGPSDFLSRTIWWIFNLNKTFTASGVKLMLSATFSNADQGGSTGSWFNCLINGVTALQNTPNGSTDSLFMTAVAGLSAVDSSYADYYYNSVNISQVDSSTYDTSLAATLADYDSGNSSWPGTGIDVPLLFMEVFAPNRDPLSNYDQAKAAVAQVTALESYISANAAGTASSKTYFMGYNYFEFNDEPALTKATGLYGFGQTPVVLAKPNTGITSQSYGDLPNMIYPLYQLDENVGPDDTGSLVKSIAACWPS